MSFHKQDTALVHMYFYKIFFPKEKPYYCHFKEFEQNILKYFMILI